MQDIPLHDIKPLVEVPDNSLIILIILAGVILSLVLISLAIWAWTKFKKIKEVNLRKVYLEKIHDIDTSDAKQAAYEISEYARYIVKTDKEKSFLDDLDKRLAQYKYKKEVQALDEETLAHFQVFLEVLDAT
ncbi:MAG TPA: hypothetical protein EYO73_00115 [Sulfurimonas sp.]|nr:hypothetical protein [Sulfurimonas sp.]